MSEPVVLLAVFLIAGIVHINTQMSYWWDLSIKAALVIAVFVGLFSLNLFLETRAVRKLLRNSELRKFEGLWAQNVGIDARPYSIGLIKFNQKQGHWTYDGIGFNHDFKQAADWQAISLYFDNRDSRRDWFFSGDAHLRHYNSALKTYVQDSQTAHVVPILRLPAGSVGEVPGRVADIGVGGKETIFWVALKRVPSELSNQPSSIDDILRMEPADLKKLLLESRVEIHD